MKLPEELKKAISHLPSVEKDKLIFRLLRKDLAIANRLLFELVSERSVEDLRDEVQEKLKHYCEIASNNIFSTALAFNLPSLSTIPTMGVLSFALLPCDPSIFLFT